MHEGEPTLLFGDPFHPPLHTLLLAHGVTYTITASILEVPTLSKQNGYWALTPPGQSPGPSQDSSKGLRHQIRKQFRN